MAIRTWVGGVVLGAWLLGGQVARAQIKDFDGNSPDFGNNRPDNRSDNRQAGRRGYLIDTNNPSFLIYPGLRDAPSPDWVKPGLRLTFYAASATIPQSYVGGLVQDPNGRWVDPKTGKSYRMEGNASASGHGYTQIDVLALTDDAVVYDVRALGIEGVDGPVRFISATGCTTPPGAAGDWWVNPDVLNQSVDNLNGPGVRSQRMPYKAAKKQYDAVWISTTTGNGSISYVIDLNGGMTLHTATCTSSAGGVTNINGVPTNVGGSTSLGQTTFIGMREIQVPWMGQPLPQSLSQVRELVYEGQSTVSIEGVSTSIPMRAVVDIIGRGPDFIQIKKMTTLNYGNGVPPEESTTVAVSGTSQILPLCIPPRALANLRNGQEIDRDPFTMINTFVSFIGQDQSGNQVVTLTEIINDNAPRTDYVYDMRSGILSAVQMTDPTMHTQNTLYRVR